MSDDSKKPKEPSGSALLERLQALNNVRASQKATPPKDASPDKGDGKGDGKGEAEVPRAETPTWAAAVAAPPPRTTTAGTHGASLPSPGPRSSMGIPRQTGSLPAEPAPDPKPGASRSAELTAADDNLTKPWLSPEEPARLATEALPLRAAKEPAPVQPSPAAPVAQAPKSQNPQKAPKAEPAPKAAKASKAVADSRAATATPTALVTPALLRSLPRPDTVKNLLVTHRVAAMVGGVGLVVGLGLGAILFGGGGDRPAPTVQPAVSAPCPEPQAAREPPPVEAAAVAPSPAVSAPAAADAGTEAADSAAAVAEGTGTAAGTDGGPLDLGLGKCVVSVTSEPQGATLVVAGNSVGETPRTVAGLPCDAAVDVSISRSRYEAWAKRLTLSSSTPAEVHATLRRPQVSLDVRSAPPGAAVSIDGRSVGKTPLTRTVPGYERTRVKVSLSGYRTYEQSLTPRPGRSGLVKATLQKAGSNPPAKSQKRSGGRFAR